MKFSKVVWVDMEIVTPTFSLQTYMYEKSFGVTCNNYMEVFLKVL